jgi:hypothetical protein
MITRNTKGEKQMGMQILSIAVFLIIGVAAILISHYINDGRRNRSRQARCAYRDLSGC